MGELKVTAPCVVRDPVRNQFEIGKVHMQSFASDLEMFQLGSDVVHVTMDVGGGVDDSFVGVSYRTTCYNLKVVGGTDVVYSLVALGADAHSPGAIVMHVRKSISLVNKGGNVGSVVVTERDPEATQPGWAGELIGSNQSTTNKGFPGSVDGRTVVGGDVVKLYNIVENGDQPSVPNLDSADQRIIFSDFEKGIVAVRKFLEDRLKNIMKSGVRANGNTKILSTTHHLHFVPANIVQGSSGLIGSSSGDAGGFVGVDMETSTVAKDF